MKNPIKTLDEKKYDMRIKTERDAYGAIMGTRSRGEPSIKKLMRKIDVKW